MDEGQVDGMKEEGEGWEKWEDDACKTKKKVMGATDWSSWLPWLWTGKAERGLMGPLQSPHLPHTHSVFSFLSSESVSFLCVLRSIPLLLLNPLFIMVSLPVPH